MYGSSSNRKMTTSERELASASRYQRTSNAQASNQAVNAPSRGNGSTQLNSQRFRFTMVDIVEVWRRGLVLRVAPFVGRATSTG
jgi:hypothetical protein